MNDIKRIVETKANTITVNASKIWLSYGFLGFLALFGLFNAIRFVWIIRQTNKKIGVYKSTEVIENGGITILPQEIPQKILNILIFIKVTNVFQPKKPTIKALSILIKSLLLSINTLKEVGC